MNEQKGTPGSSGTGTASNESQPTQRRNQSIAECASVVKAAVPQLVDSVANALTRTRPHEVPSTVPAVIRAGIPGSIRAGRSFRQEAKDSNASQHVVTELYCRAEFRRLEDKINFLLERKAA